jgi:hypothetical protein
VGHNADDVRRCAVWGRGCHVCEFRCYVVYLILVVVL